jgi:hypothetical protein
MCQSFGTPCSIFIGVVIVYTTYEDGTDCSVMAAHKIQEPGNNPKKEYKILR